MNSFSAEIIKRQ